MSIYDLIDQVSAIRVTKKPTHFNKAILATLKHEGGFVNDPVDPGGATNWGMSLRYLKGRGDLDGDRRLDGDMDGDGDVDVNDIKKMSVEQAVKLYYTGFWLPNNYDNIKDYTIAAKVFDMTVNMGSIQAGKILQRSVNRLGFGLKVDGAVGPKTFSAVNASDPDLLIAELRQEQARFYINLIARNPQFAKYKNGWLRRAYA
jgi:lysozyme family protein